MNHLNDLLKIMYCNFLLSPCKEINMSFNNVSIVLCASGTPLYCKVIKIDAYMKEQKAIFELVMSGPAL